MSVLSDFQEIPPRNSEKFNPSRIEDKLENKLRTHLKKRGCLLKKVRVSGDYIEIELEIPLDKVGVPLNFRTESAFTHFTETDPTMDSFDKEVWNLLRGVIELDDVSSWSVGWHNDTNFGASFYVRI